MTLAQYLFAPASVAIVGQSDDPKKTAGRPLRYLRRAGFAGRVYPVNPRRDTVLGERAWPSLSSLPEVPEHAYLVASTEAVMEAAAECGRLGVKVATLLADGFGEAGAAGHAREEALRNICAETGLRIVGPSSLGLADLRHGALITANAAFDEADLPRGRIFAASHSGGMIGTLLSRGKARGIGFAGFVSVGGELDLSMGEICASVLDDDGIDGFVLFLETLRHADRLRAFAIEAAKRNKPVLAYKLGRSEEARELAATHTGALAGADDVADAFLAACGIARVETLDGLIEGFPLLAKMRRPGARKNVAVVTTTAGGASMVVDPLAMRGVQVTAPSEATLAALRERTDLAVAPARIVDLTIAGAKYAIMKAALDVLTTAPEFDLVVAVVGSSARFHPDLAVKPIVDSANAKTPIAAFLVPDAPDALAQLSAAGVPAFRTPEACADAVAAVLRRRTPKDFAAAQKPTGEAKTLDEQAAYAVLDTLGISRAPSVALNLPLESEIALPFAFPVAVKALSETLAHKSDAGGVILNVADEPALRAAANTIANNTGVTRILVQPMIKGLAEVLVGYRVDPDAGPLVMLAAGGVLAELHRDRALRLAPITHDDAREMIAEVKALRALGGYRNLPRGDLDALADALVKLSQLAHDPGIVEAEINPLLVRAPGESVVAVDALVQRIA